MTQPPDSKTRILVLDKLGILSSQVSRMLRDQALPPGVDTACISVLTTENMLAATELIQDSYEQCVPVRCIYVSVNSRNETALLSGAQAWWQIDPDIKIVVCTDNDDIAWRDLIDAFDNVGGWMLLRGPINDDVLAQMTLMFTKQCQNSDTTELDRLRCELIEAYKNISMVEVSNGVLHNVGNVLNSVNVSTGILHDRLEHSGIHNLLKAIELMKDHVDHLPEFIESDERGMHLPAYLINLGHLLSQEQEEVGREIAMVSKNMEHIKQIISTQQSYARRSGYIEAYNMEDLVEDALKISIAGLEQQDVLIRRDYMPVPDCLVDRNKVLQILVNLISNAKAALVAAPGERILQLCISPSESYPNYARIQVTDNGIGISQENLEHIFEHGFSTRSEGHGFGLHSAVRAAHEMSGYLSASSDGPGKGATFTLDMPLSNETVNSIST